MQESSRLKKGIVISTFVLSALYLLAAVAFFFVLSLIDFQDIMAIEHPIVVFILMIGFVAYVLAIGLGSTAAVFGVLFFIAGYHYANGTKTPFILYMVHLVLMALVVVGILRAVIGLWFFGTPIPNSFLGILAIALIVCIALMVPSLLVFKYHQTLKALKNPSPETSL